MSYALGFDIYGTLVNPLEMNRHLRTLVGDQAERFAEIWLQKRIEYAFRRGLMGAYENFGVCTSQSLQYTMRAFDVDLSEQDQQWLMEMYQHLEPFPDVLPGLSELSAQGHTVTAFSNGVESTTRELLAHGDILNHLDDVISVDDLATFKPNPDVYRYLAQRLDRPLSETWLISGNSWDVIGAKAAGLRAVWIKRAPAAVFDPWGIKPDLVVSDVTQLAGQLRSPNE